eukprot:TRINITY_DN12870_c0_g1_i1.p2 TRINITY_DN12870_c0_g1~~TRINITY_DN12870_c0_g1_i1.p2  ORF type:complete len:155 (+),score=91.49 TRINITY_DN12870_c0_g1_i1:165-629(+)
MAFHGPSYGMSADVAETLKSKYDPEIEGEVRKWLEAVTGEKIGDFHEDMKSGVFLCNLANKIRPDSIKKINKGKMPFMQMENIGNYLNVVTSFGVAKTDLFQTVDLFESKNMTSVLNHLYALGRRAHSIPGFNGPSINAKDVKIDPERVFSSAN